MIDIFLCISIGIMEILHILQAVRKVGGLVMHFGGTNGYNACKTDDKLFYVTAVHACH